MQPEFARPYYALTGKDANGNKLNPPRAEIVVASPKGGEAPIDQKSVDNFKDDDSVRFYETEKSLWQQTQPLSDFIGRASEFDAVFFPGGHGPMFDLVDDENSLKVISEFYQAGKIVAAVCHGPIVLVNVQIDGKPLIEGRRVTGFSNEEEDIIGLTKVIPKLLEDAVKRAGGIYIKADKPWGEQVVVDGRLITGQTRPRRLQLVELLPSLWVRYLHLHRSKSVTQADSFSQVSKFTRNGAMQQFMTY